MYVNCKIYICIKCRVGGAKHGQSEGQNEKISGKVCIYQKFSVILHRKCKKGKSMSKDSFIKYKSAEERAAAIRGMLNLKNEWLDYVQRREAELGIR